MPSLAGSTALKYTIKSQEYYNLTLKALITTAADDILNYCFHVSDKIRLGISCESSAKQTIHMECQVLFCMKNKKQIMKKKIIK